MTAWRVAAKQGNPEILHKIWAWARKKLTTEKTNNEMLLAEDNIRMNAWQVAVKQGNVEFLQDLLEWYNRN
jgi:hypothetical protein